MSRRDEIIKAARKVALNQGVQHVSVRKVAAEAGIGASTLRYYFPTSKDLFAAIAESDLGDFVTSEGLKGSSASPHERFAEALAQFLPENDAHLGQLEQMLTSYQVAFDAGKLVGHDVVRESASKGVAIVESWLRELEEQGAALRMDTRSGAELALTVVNGLAIDLITRAPEFKMSDARERLIQVASIIVKD